MADDPDDEIRTLFRIWEYHRYITNSQNFYRDLMRALEPHMGSEVIRNMRRLNAREIRSDLSLLARLSAVEGDPVRAYRAAHQGQDPPDTPPRTPPRTPPGTPPPRSPPGYPPGYSPPLLEGTPPFVTPTAQFGQAPAPQMTPATGQWTPPALGASVTPATGQWTPPALGAAISPVPNPRFDTPPRRRVAPAAPIPLRPLGQLPAHNLGGPPRRVQRPAPQQRGRPPPPPQ